MTDAKAGLGVVPDLVLSVFRLSGLLVEAGNQIVGGIGLTTAWWQVLGALGYASAPLSVAQIARNMGLTRQSVHRVVAILIERGLVEPRLNPDHRRAKLMVLTARGEQALRDAEEAAGPMNGLILDRVGLGRIDQAREIVAEMSSLLAARNEWDSST